MSHTNAEQRALDSARQAHEAARLVRARCQAARAAAAEQFTTAKRTWPPGSPAWQQAADALADAEQRLAAARADERTARDAVAATLAAWLAPEVAADVATLTADFPLVLLPVRLETRFDPISAPTSLRVRIYPDAIFGDTHEPWLTTAERDAGQDYWRAFWADPTKAADAWTGLLGRYPAQRAAWLVRATEPADLTTPEPLFPPASLRPGEWTRAAEARALPDRWIVIGYRLDPAQQFYTEVARAQSRPVVEPLALTLNPDPDIAAGASVWVHGLEVDEDAAWAFDFRRAVGAGMAVELPVPAIAPERGYDRILVLGVKASIPPRDAAARLGGLLDAHHYTRGLAFVPQGTPTNNTSRAASGFPPPDRGGAASFAVERGDPITERDGDGPRWIRALGLTGAHLDLHLGGAERVGGGASEQQAAAAMNQALWPATLGYFLEQAMAPVFGPDIVAEARRYFVEQVRGRGPYPAVRVGGTPYGLLPVSSLNRWAPLSRAPSLLAFQLQRRLRTWPGRPAVCSPEPDRLDVFVRGDDSGLHHRWLAGDWSAWEPLGGELVGDPAAVADAAGRIDVVARGARGVLLHLVLDPGDPSHPADWEVVDGELTGDPAASSPSPGRLDVVAQGPDGRLLHRALEQGNWSAWQPLDGGSAADPAAVSWGEGRIDLVARGPGSALLHRVFEGGQWLEWEALLEAAGAPTIASPAAGRLEVVVALRDGRLGQLSFEQRGTFGTWSDVAGLNGAAATDLAATGWGGGLLELVARDAEGGLVRRSQHLDPARGPVWSAWQPVDPASMSADLRVGRDLDTTGAASRGWSDPAEIPGGFGPGSRGGGITVADLSGNGRPDLVVLHFELGAGGAHASYRIGWNLDPTGAVTDGWSAPAEVPAALGRAVRGGGVALADLNDSGQADLVVAYLDETGGWYRVGRDLDATGAVTGGWGPPLPMPVAAGPADWVSGAALADLNGNGRQDLVVLQLAPAAGGSQARYAVGRDLDTAGAVAGGWTPPIPVPVPFDLGAVTDGGVGVADLDSNGQPELVVLLLGAGRGWHAVGWNLDPAGVPTGGWTPLGDLPGPFGARPQGAALAIADLNIRPVVGDRLAGILRTVRDVWRDGVPNVPRVGASGDLDGDLLRTLGMDASAREVRVRPVLGSEFLLNLQRYLGTGYFGMTAPGNWQAWLQQQRALVDQALRAIGPPAWNPATNTRGWDPRIAGMVASQDVSRFANTLVTVHTQADQPISERDPLQPENYIDWLLIHGGDINQLRSGLKGLVGEEPPLLALLLLHALLREHARVGMDLLTAASPPAASPADRRERELVGMPVVDPSGQVTVHNTIWDWFATQFPGTGATTLAEHLATLWPGPAAPAADGPYESFAAALTALRDLPTAELERLFTETLDVCSHRLDAWITSMAADRLDQLRRSFPAGCHLAAFGWVEDLKPGPSDRYKKVTLDGQPLLVQQGSGGHVQAPSLTHAAAAAVLRNAHLTRAGADRTRYAVDLSSARVRAARALFDVLRDGQPLGAVLGYRVERGLHERAQAGPPQASLERFIDPLRDAFPLVAGKGPKTAAPPAPARTVAARNVVDGLALRAAWHAGSVDLSKLAPGEPAAVVQALRIALAAEVAALDELLDAAADLLTAEGVYQLIRGNPTAAAASLDALAQGLRPPDPEIAVAPRGGTTLTHRVAVVLGEPALPVRASWPATATDRAQAEPFVDGWAGALLGDPATIKCRARTVEPDGSATEHEVTLADLELRPIDVLALAPSAGTTPAAGELDRRVAWAALASASAHAEVRITYTAAPGWNRATVRTFPEILELARSLQAVLGSARPLRPADLVPPEAAGIAQGGGWLGAATLLRAETARSRLETLARHVGAARKALDLPAGTSPPASAFTEARDALRAAALFGIAGAFPASRNGASEAARAALVGQAGSVHAEASRRHAEATAVHDALQRRIDELRADDPSADVDDAAKVDAAITIAAAVFGRDTPFLPTFRPPASAELGQALAGGPASLGVTPLARAKALRKWVQQVGRVRPPMARWRRLTLYAETLGAPAALEVAQLPFRDGERWVGLPVGAIRPPSGRVSLVLHRPAAPAAGGIWAGLLVDEWTELIPNERELTGITFHYDNPGAEAPQAVLLAVPPTGKATWDLETVLDVLHETLDLAKLRAVDAQLVGGLGQLLPATLLAANAQRDTISTNFSKLRVADP